MGEDGSVITENGNPVVNLASGKFWANNHVHVIDNKECIDFSYLYYALALADIKVFVHGSIPKLSQGDLKLIEIPLPPHEEQKRISNLLSDYDNLITTNVEELDILKKTKLQIMTDIFSTEI